MLAGSLLVNSQRGVLAMLVSAAVDPGLQRLHPLDCTVNLPTVKFYLHDYVIKMLGNGERTRMKQVCCNLMYHID